MCGEEGERTLAFAAGFVNGVFRLVFLQRGDGHGGLAWIVGGVGKELELQEGAVGLSDFKVALAYLRHRIST